jgi:glutamine synthetase
VTYTTKEVLQFVQENDVKFVKLAFCDIWGVQKNISIVSRHLEAAFEEGVAFDASSIAGFLSVEKSDLCLFPDPATLHVLPWRPQQGRVVRFFCDIRYPDGAAFEGDTRRLLAEASDSAEEMGLFCRVGSECDFYLFHIGEDGTPTDTPFDNAGYLDVAPLDRGENVRRDICLYLDQMGVTAENSHHERGPGQYGVDIHYCDIRKAADDLVILKSAVDSIAAANGLWASFMPKPIEEQNGNGLHLNFSLAQNGRNIFRTDGTEHSPTAESFIAGILAHIAEITAVANPLLSSYIRFAQNEAPPYISWAHQNRSQLIRIPAASGDHSRMELRSPDPAANPHLLLTLLLHAGLDGVRQSLPLPPPIDVNMYEQGDDTEAQRLPQSLGDALDCMADSDFVRSILGDVYTEKYVRFKREETR